MNKFVSEEKKRLRKKYQSIRKQLTDNQVTNKSRSITQKVTTLSAFKQADTVHSYIAMEKKREVVTRDIIEQCFDEGKTVVIPKIKKRGELSHHIIQHFGELTPNSWGVEEPLDNEEYSIENLSIILVPMVSGDYLKNRLGYGKGYYDRFLSRTNALKIGLLYDDTIYDKVLPTDDFDVPLDLLVTESKIID